MGKKKRETLVREALAIMPVETAEALSSILDQPRSIGRKVLAQIPFGSRVALEDLGIITRDDDGHDLTDFGFDVTLAAAKKYNSEIK